MPTVLATGSSEAKTPFMWSARDPAVDFFWCVADGEIGRSPEAEVRSGAGAGAPVGELWAAAVAAGVAEASDIRWGEGE